MSVTSMLKQNLHLLAIMQEEMPPLNGIRVGIANAVFNSLNSFFFICSQTSASVNGEHFPQIPLILGSSLFALGLSVELLSEVRRAAWKKSPEHKGKVYQGGLFALSRHINYFGFTMWRTGYALAAGGWVWGATNAAFFTYGFVSHGIPMLQQYLEEKVSLTSSRQSVVLPSLTECIVRGAIRALQEGSALQVHSLSVVNAASGKLCPSCWQRDCSLHFVYCTKRLYTTLLFLPPIWWCV